ncbi:Integral membrane protein [Lasiodiplodia theobromae]|uniref:Integral membrane protein n=1 Tax=Lasiodiplodia theobromae TaxID=45133 RepID=UPI0015C39247|nr:Integral membrane protein [Lasiodiplodia theobromae]KAF4537993.1 Integral membrane protein [Lasiodiplodia theobromae]
MARFLSKISSRVTTIRYWLRASGSSPQHEDGNMTLRIYTRAFLARSLGWDDCAMILAMLGSLTICLLRSLQVSYGLGTPLSSTPPKYQILRTELIWAVLFPYYIGLCLVKASALLQMLRVFAIPRVRTVCLTLLSLVALFAFWRTVTALITCHRPPFTAPSENKHLLTRTGQCVEPYPLLYINCALNIAMDVIITMVPLRVISRLRLAAHRKRMLTAVFALGLIPTIPSAIRLHAIMALQEHGAPRQFITSSPMAAIWTALDINTAIICACVPALGPLYTRLASRLRPAGSKDDANLCTMVLSPSTPSPSALMAGSVSIITRAAAGVAVPMIWRQQQDKGKKAAVGPDDQGYDKRIGDGAVGAVVASSAAVDDEDDDEDYEALSDLAEFAGFTGLTGDASLDGFLVAARLEKATSREELLAVANSMSTRSGSEPTVRAYEVLGYDHDDTNITGDGVSEGRASSRIEFI